MNKNELLIQKLPLFPLPLVLFPGGLLPLRIFEVRYLDMVKHCHQSQVPFGVVATLPPPPDRTPRPEQGPEHLQDDDGIEGFAPETFHELGSLAYVQNLERPQPGLINVLCSGKQRFRIKSTHQQRYGLWVADVVLIDNDPTIPVPVDLIPTSETLQQLVHSMEQQLDNIAQMPIALPYHWNDCSWVANRWCELLPINVVQKQRLMTLDNPLVRLELVSDMLDQMGLSQPQQS